MKFPSKVTTYRQSIVSKFPIILNELEKQDDSVGGLYKRIEKKVDGPEEYVQALDCLFFLGKIKFISGGEILHYVERDIL